MKNQSVRFIATTTGLLKKLQQMDLVGKDNISFEVKEHKIFIPDCNMEYYPSDIDGMGSFTYPVDSILNLLKCLRALNEQPITIRLTESYITIGEIIF